MLPPVLISTFNYFLVFFSFSFIIFFAERGTVGVICKGKWVVVYIVVYIVIKFE